MQSLQPLRVVDVALPAGDGTRFASVGQNDLKATRFEHLVGGDPVHAGRFHHHRLGTRGNQPVGHALQIRGKCLERLHWLIA